jgi:hypothetical protein
MAAPTAVVVRQLPKTFTTQPVGSVCSTIVMQASASHGKSEVLAMSACVSLLVRRALLWRRCMIGSTAEHLGHDDWAVWQESRAIKPRARTRVCRKQISRLLTSSL